MKILILKPSSLGDIVQALPVLRLLKQHFPKSEIHWWICSEFVPLLEEDPDLAGVFPFDRQRWASPLNWRELFASIHAMREQRFDWVIDLQGLARSGVFAWLARGNLTVGVDDAREGARGLYDVAVPRPSPTTHAVDWYLEVLRTLKVPVHRNFTWLPARPEAAKALAEKWRPDSAPWAVINPGARWLNKRWPAEYFAELVRQLAERNAKTRFAILGGKSDAALGAVIAQAAPARCFDLTGKTTLPEMIEWIRLSQFTVTNDTGPMHVAAALNKPVIALFGPTNPQRTGPYGRVEQVLRISLPCAPCLKSTCTYAQPMECLRAIRPETVVAAIDRAITKPVSRPQ